jgi:2'-5' RNA ligase
MGVKVLPPDNYHITLKFLGDVPDAMVKETGDALAAVEFAPFQVELSGAGAYPNIDYPRAIYVAGESEGASALAGKVEAALARFNFPRENREFSVHLTVARAKTVGDIREFLERTGKVCSWEARSFVLMKSALLPQGASYEVLREYQAQG